MNEKGSFKNEKVLEKAVDVTTQYTARFFDIVSDHELVYSNLEDHVLAIYGVDDSSSPVALTPYFDGLTTYNIKDYFEVPTIKTYYIVDITEHTGKDCNECEYTPLEEAMEEVGFYEEEDKVNQPSHYTFSDKFEIIDVVEEITSQYPPELAFAVGNAVKYISRAPHKNGKQDIEKSLWYIQRILKNWDDAHE